MRYYYNLTFDEIAEYDNYGILKKDDDIYIFKRVFQSEEEIKYIISSLVNNKIPVHVAIINRDNSVITEYNKENYILLRVQDVIAEVSDNILMLPTFKIENDIGELWARKVDYYMQQVRELGLGKELLVNSFNYYIGMAENAISIYNRAKLLGGDVGYSIAHRRIYYPNYSINYYDPTNMLIDVRVRDVTGYIKSKFFANNVTVSEALGIIYKYQFNNKEINLLFARLLYPTYYFDVFEDGIVNGIEEDKIIQLLNKRTEFEKLLWNLYQNLKHNYEIYEIEWLKK